MEHLARKFGFCVALAENPNADYFQARHRINGLYIGSRIDRDPDFEKSFQHNIKNIDVTQALTKSDQLDKLESRFTDWVLSHETNKITGLESFEPDYSEGSTQAFDSFYLRHKDRRFRCLVGEYFYHIKTWSSIGTDWSWLSNVDDLDQGDALVVSVPFCDTARKPKELEALLARCDELGIPVLLDLCYWIISSGLEIDLNHECIDTVAFSLSKAWPVSTARIGMRYTRKDTFDGQKLHSTIGYNNNLGAYIGNILLDIYAPDWIHKQRVGRYNSICDVFKLEKTNSVNFGLGDNNWNTYSRRLMLESYGLDYDPSLFVNRICFNKIYQHWDLFKDFIKNELDIEI